MTEYSRIAKGSFTSTGAAKFIPLPFIPDRIEMTNYTASAAFTQHLIPSAVWDVNMGQGYGVCTYCNGATPVLTTAVITSGGFTTFTASTIQLGTSKQIIGITKANPAVVNVTAHGYKVGDTVVMTGLYQSATTGMPQISGIFFTITAVGDADHFTINWNTNQSNYTALSGSPSGSTVAQVLFPFVYAPQINTPYAITTGTTTTVTCTTYHNFVVGQEIAFRVGSQFGITQLNSLPNSITPGSPIYGYVTSITDNWTFVCNINSTGYTAYNTNQTVASVPGLTLPIVLAVGDVNTGGEPITSTSVLYPPPQFPTSSSRVGTINGPAIKGAFVNNTRQGFIIGTGNAVFQASADTSSSLVGANNDVIYWAAYLDDISVT